MAMHRYSSKIGTFIVLLYFWCSDMFRSLDRKCLLCPLYFSTKTASLSRDLCLSQRWQCIDQLKCAVNNRGLAASPHYKCYAACSRWNVRWSYELMHIRVCKRIRDPFSGRISLDKCPHARTPPLVAASLSVGMHAIIMLLLVASATMQCWDWCGCNKMFCGADCR